MENEEKKELSLEEQFEQLKIEQQKEIENLKQKLSERDNLIRKYMTIPSNQKSDIGEQEIEENEITQDDIKKVLDKIYSKRR